MKSKRILQLILVGIVVIVVAVTGFMYLKNSGEVKQQKTLTADISRNQATLNSGLIEKVEAEQQKAALEKQLAEAKALLSQQNFRSSAESIEYDRLLFSISDFTDLQITSLFATSPLDTKEEDVVYHLTTFTIFVSGKTPTSIFGSSYDSIKYSTDVVNNILAYVDKLATTKDFDTTMIQSVNIATSESMTDEQIATMITVINGLVRGEFAPEELEGKTEAEIIAMVQSKLAAKSPAEMQQLMDKAGWQGNASAVITIKIWTYEKGA